VLGFVLHKLRTHDVYTLACKRSNWSSGVIIVECLSEGMLVFVNILDTEKCT
jgi:hypothetical protein